MQLYLRKRIQVVAGMDLVVAVGDSTLVGDSVHIAFVVVGSAHIEDDYLEEGVYLCFLVLRLKAFLSNAPHYSRYHCIQEVNLSKGNDNIQSK